MAEKNGTELKNKLADKASTPVKAGDPANTIASYLKRMEGEIQRALPKHMDADRLARIALTTIRTNPTLLECSVPSLLAATMQAAQLGLEPGLLGHCYFVPFWDSKSNQRQVQFIVGYRGMIDLARRSGNIQSISAREVYENDFFELEYGIDEKIVHIPWHIRTDNTYKESGKLRGCYMVAKFKDGGYYLHYMSLAEIEQHKGRSKAASSGPWKTDYIEMCKKTVVRAGWKWLPISVEIMSQAETADETAKTGVGIQDEYIDISFAATDIEETDVEGQPEPSEGDPELFNEQAS